jgi:hypothetical protein
MTSHGRRRRAAGRLMAAVCMAAALAGCDYFAEKKLVVGEHTEEDVRRLMGKPEIVWEEENGAKKLEYPRGPMGTQTYFVFIGPDGRYRGMERALVETNFAKVQVGMSPDDVRRILGKQTEVTPYALAREEVWSWRYEGDAQKTMFFNAHFDQASRRVKRISRNEDWKTQGGPS